MATSTLSERDEMIERFVVLDAVEKVSLGACGMLSEVDALFADDLADRANLEAKGAASLGSVEWRCLWPGSDEGVGFDEETLAEVRGYVLAAEMLQAFADDPEGCRRLAGQLLERGRQNVAILEKAISEKTEAAAAVSATIERLSDV